MIVAEFIITHKSSCILILEGEKYSVVSNITKNKTYYLGIREEYQALLEFAQICEYEIRLLGGR